MKKILAVVALLAFSSSAQANTDEQKLCLMLASNTADFYMMWTANMDPKEIIRTFRSSINNEELKEVITLVISANYLHYHKGTDLVSAEKQITNACKEVY